MVPISPFGSKKWIFCAEIQLFWAATKILLVSLRLETRKEKKLHPLSSTFLPAEDIIDATLASMPHRVEDYADFWETGEIEVYVDAPTSLPASSQPSTIPSKASYSSVAASAQVPTEKKANPLLCTHCGLSKFGHPGPTGDRCHVPKQPNL